MEEFNSAALNTTSEESFIAADLLGNDKPLLDMEGIENLATSKNMSHLSSGADALDDIFGNSQSGLVSTTRPLVTSNDDEVSETTKHFSPSPTSNLLDYANDDFSSSLIESGADTRVEDSFRDQPGGDRLLIDDDLLADKSDVLISAPKDNNKSLGSLDKKLDSQPKELLPKVKDPKIDIKPKAESDNYQWGNRACETAAQPAVESEVAMEEIRFVGNQSENCESECPFTPGAWFNPEKLHPVVADYVYWKDPKKSGIAFGTSLVLLLSLKYFSFISVSAYITLAILTVTVSFRVYKNVLQAVQKSNEGHPFKEYLEMDIALSQDKVSETVEVLIQHMNCVTGKLRSLVLVEDLFDTLKLVLLAWFLTYVGAWFNGLTLIILGLVAVFTLPKVYETNKTQIDVYAELVRTKGKEIVEMVNAKMPMGKKKKEQ